MFVCYSRRELNLKKLDYSNYGEYFNNLLHLEENQMQIDIKHYTMHDVQMQKDSRSGLLKLEVCQYMKLMVADTLVDISYEAVFF